MVFIRLRVSRFSYLTFILSSFNYNFTTHVTSYVVQFCIQFEYEVSVHSILFLFNVCIIHEFTVFIPRTSPTFIRSWAHAFKREGTGWWEYTTWSFLALCVFAFRLHSACRNTFDYCCMWYIEIYHMRYIYLHWLSWWSSITWQNPVGGIWYLDFVRSDIPLRSVSTFHMILLACFIACLLRPERTFNVAWASLTYMSLIYDIWMPLSDENTRMIPLLDMARFLQLRWYMTSMFLTGERDLFSYSFHGILGCS